MAGESAADEAHFKGLSKYFNSHTNLGRANVAKATYGVCALIGIYMYLKPKKK